MRFLQCLLLLFIYTVYVISEPCTTPDGEQGECVFIDDCPPLANAITNYINGTKKLLINYKCKEGKNGNHFGVCCIPSWNSANYGNKLSDRRYCGYQHTDDYFPTGNATSLDEFPWLAALVIYDPDIGQDRIFCQGSLINNRYVLTTARCVWDYHIGEIRNFSKVLLGKYHTKNSTSCVDLKQYGLECTEVQEFGTEEKIVHHFYFAYDSLCDIALIRLNKTISYTDYIRPICLPTQGTKFAGIGETLYTTGWGSVNRHENQLATVKKKVKTTLIPPEECRKRLEEYKVSSTYHICTVDLETNNEFTCSRDGGAPVMFSYRNQWQIEGIVSRGLTCGTKYPGLHTRVSTFIGWIKQNLRP